MAEKNIDNGSERYHIHLPLNKQMQGVTYVQQAREHRFYMKHRPWLLESETKTSENTKIAPSLEFTSIIKSEINNKFHFQVCEQ